MAAHYCCGLRRAGCSFLLLPAILCLFAAGTATAPIRYQSNFARIAVGKLPEEFMVLNGDFTIADEHAKHCLELAGEPLDTFGLLFGPADLRACDVSARIWADRSGKRYPEFGIGSNDAGGFKLWMLPGQEKLELRKGDEVKATAQFAWTAASWLRLRLRVREAGPEKWIIEGKFWPDSAAEPSEWNVRWEDTAAPDAGRASVWGIPFSGKSIRFDDLGAGVTLNDSD